MKQNKIQNTRPEISNSVPQNHVEVSNLPVQGRIDPELIRIVVDNGSLIAMIVALTWFFKILTRFVEVCQKD